MVVGVEDSESYFYTRFDSTETRTIRLPLNPLKFSGTKKRCYGLKPTITEWYPKVSNETPSFSL